MQINKLMYILLTVNMNILYSLGEMSLIKYFYKHPHKNLSCEVDSGLDDPILTDNYLCSISYKNSIYTITLSLDGKDTKIELKNIGTCQEPLFKIINQDEFTSSYFMGKKIFVDANPVVFERNHIGISLYFEYVKGLSKETDNIFLNLINIAFYNNEGLKDLEKNYSVICSPAKDTGDFEKSVISNNNAVLSTKTEIDEIYKKSMERFHWNKLCQGCSLKALSLSYAIKNIFPEKPQPILIQLNKEEGNGFYFHGFSTKFRVHYALGYVSDKKLYILDPLVGNEVIDGVMQWLGYFRGRIGSISECIINTY